MTGRERWLKETDISMARLRVLFAVNDADEIVWLTGHRKGTRAGRNGVIHSVLDGSPYLLKESRVFWALKHGAWPPDGHEVALGNRNRGDEALPSKAREFPFVLKTRNGKFITHVLARGRRFNFGPYDDPETAYRVYLFAKKTLDPDNPVRPVKGVKLDAKGDDFRVAIGILRGGRRGQRRPRRLGPRAAAQ